MKVRFPGDLKQRLTEAATANARSINSEIIQRLEDSFRVTTQASGPTSSDQELGKLIVEMHHELMSRKKGSLLRRPRDPLSMLPVNPKSSRTK
jgi:methylglyoxal synthase